jgi:hypothetical protein
MATKKGGLAALLDDDINDTPPSHRGDSRESYIRWCVHHVLYHHFADADKRWSKVPKKGLSDAEMWNRIKFELGIFGRSSGPGYFVEYKGEGNPYIQPLNPKSNGPVGPKIKGNALLSICRGVTGIYFEGNPRTGMPFQDPVSKTVTPKQSSPEKPHTIRVRYQGDTYHAIDDRSWKKCTSTGGHSKAVWNLLEKQGIKAGIQRRPHLEKSMRDPKRADHEQWQVYEITPVSDIVANRSKEIGAMNTKFLEQVKENNAKISAAGDAKRAKRKMRRKWSPEGSLSEAPVALTLTKETVLIGPPDAIDPTAALLGMVDKENRQEIPELKEAQPPKPVTVAELSQAIRKGQGGTLRGGQALQEHAPQAHELACRTAESVPQVDTFSRHLISTNDGQKELYPEKRISPHHQPEQDDRWAKR